MTKFSYFFVVNTIDSTVDYVNLYINENLRFHRVPLSIISYKSPQLTSHFWKPFLKGLGTKINLSTTFYIKKDGQTECTIQTLEDMLRACVINLKGISYNHLFFIDFSYNNI